MPTYNGATFLAEQLESIGTQTHQPDLLIVSDDGSSDDSCAIIRDFARRAPFDVRLHTGPRKGLALNMRGLLANCPAGHVALADQDDVWLPHKLERAHARLGSTQQPTLYAARRMVTNKALTPQGLTKIPRARPCFAHALRRNIAPGNTLVLNPAAQATARDAALRAGPLPDFHDWWLYQLITGAGGTAIFDPMHVLLYRQHAGNLFGAGRGLRATAWRLRQRVNGTYHGWLQAQCAALNTQRFVLQPDARSLLDAFMAQRNIKTDSAS